MHCILDEGEAHVVTSFVVPQTDLAGVVEIPDDDPRAVEWASGDAPVQLLNYVQTRRDQIEAGGYAWQSHTVLTDAESQRKLAAERLAVLTEDRHDDDPWVMADGPIPLKNAQVSEIASGVRSWVKNLTVARETIRAEIAAGAIKTRAAIDAAYAAIPTN